MWGLLHMDIIVECSPWHVQVLCGVIRDNNSKRQKIEETKQKAIESFARRYYERVKVWATVPNKLKAWGLYINIGVDMYLHFEVLSEFLPRPLVEASIVSFNYNNKKT
jgi:hypothetical protein